MRVVVDMNVLISATIKPNSPLAQILVYIRNGRFEFLYFPEFLKEYAQVISRPHLWEKYHLDKKEIAAVIQVMENRGVLVYIVTQVDICRDPDDNIPCLLPWTARRITLSAAIRTCWIWSPFEKSLLSNPQSS